MADPSLKDRIAEQISMRDQAVADAERTTATVERLGPAITPESLRTFVLAARRRLRNEDGTCRRDHLLARWEREGLVQSDGPASTETEVGYCPGPGRYASGHPARRCCMARYTAVRVTR